MKLKTLKPRLATVNIQRVQGLEPPPRPRGTTWMNTRRRIALAYGYKCAGCGLLWQAHKDQIDHKIPRALGGSDADDNLQPLCDKCHTAKTSQEAGMTQGSGYAL